MSDTWKIAKGLSVNECKRRWQQYFAFDQANAECSFHKCPGGKFNFQNGER